MCLSALVVDRGPCPNCLPCLTVFGCCWPVARCLLGCLGRCRCRRPAQKSPSSSPCELRRVSAPTIPTWRPWMGADSRCGSSTGRSSPRRSPTGTRTYRWMRPFRSPSPLVPGRRSCCRTSTPTETDFPRSSPTPLPPGCKQPHRYRCIETVAVWPGRSVSPGRVLSGSTPSCRVRCRPLPSCARRRSNGRSATMLTTSSSSTSRRVCWELSPSWTGWRPPPGTCPPAKQLRWAVTGMRGSCSAISDWRSWSATSPDTAWPPPPTWHSFAA